MKMTKIIAMALAALIAISACTMLASCGGKKDDKKESDDATTAATTAATVAGTTAPKATTADGQEDSGNTSAPAAPAATDSDGLIDQQTAVANVKQQAGTGAKVVSVEKGTSPDGVPCWVVVVEPVTNGEGPDTVTYYSGYLFCYAEGVEIPSDEEGGVGIDQQTAVANVKQQAGTGAQIISCEEGTSPDGLPCYVVVVAPVTNSEEAVYDTYYSGYLFCYRVSSNAQAADTDDYDYDDDYVEIEE